MIYVADTNVLLGFSYRADPRYRIVRPAVRELLINGHQLRATSQNFAEFWNVSTRPADRNGFGQKPFETDKILQRIERFFLCCRIHQLCIPYGDDLSWTIVCQVFKFTMPD